MLSIGNLLRLFLHTLIIEVEVDVVILERRISWFKGVHPLNSSKACSDRCDWNPDIRVLN